MLNCEINSLLEKFFDAPEVKPQSEEGSQNTKDTETTAVTGASEDQTESKEEKVSEEIQQILF